MAFQIEDEKKAPYDVNVVECPSFFDDGVGPYLPPKTLKQQKRLTTLNVLIIIGFVIVYGICVTLAIVPQLFVGQFPFLSNSQEEKLAFEGGTATMGNPCTAWGLGGRFETTLSFGSFSYTKAKGLDALWNFVVGRGLQAALGWMSYKLFSMAIMRVTSHTPIPVGLYKDMAFAPTSLKNVPSLMTAIWTARGWRGKAVLIWLVMAILFLLGFPTLLDLSTGYMSDDYAMIQTADNSLRNITSTQLQDLQNVAFCFQYKDMGGCGDFLHELTNTSINYFDLIDDKQNWLYYPKGPIHCVPGTQYTWGFSPGYLWITATISSIWVLGMFALWSDSLHNGILWRSGRALGDYRNILDIAQVLHERLGPDTCAHSNAEIEREAGTIAPVGFEIVTDGIQGHIRLSESPGGCEVLQDKEVEIQFGSRARLQRKAATWPLAA